MSHLTINNKRFSFEEIKYLKLEECDEFEFKTLNVCKNWLNEQKEFEISTSGSTGIPKVIKLKRTQMLSSAQMTIKTFQLGKNDHLLVNLNPEFIAGLMMLVRGLECNAEITVIKPSSNPLENFLPNTVFSFLALVPLQLQSIISNTTTKEIFQKTKSAIIGGAPVNESLLNEIKHLKPNIYSTYGMTETVTHIAVKRINGETPDLYFNALPSIEIGQDQENCLTIKGTITNGEKIVTNDVVKLIDERKFQWLGRRDNIINSGGIKIQLEKVENEAEIILKELNQIGKAVALAFPDEKLGDKLVLVLECNREKLNIDHFKKRLKDALPKLHAPKSYFFVDKIPMTPTQKVDRVELKKKLR